MASDGSWNDESAADGHWDAGAIWQLGEQGIWLGMPGLRLGVGLPHREGSFSNESPDAGSWESE